MLCEKCQELGLYPAELWQPAWLESDGGKTGIRLEHHETARNLQESARNGCHLCSLAWASLTDDRLQPEESIPQQENISFFVWRDQTYSPLTNDRHDEYRIDVQCGDLDTSLSGALRCTPMGPSLGPRDTGAYSTDNDTGSDETFHVIRCWMQVCAMHHQECQQILKSKPQLPTRVLHVGDESTRVSRLVSGFGKQESYATLSHCWGKSELLSTKLETLERRQSCIADSELPKSFMDAVTTCRKLGIKYLWIDSLCIIQDSKEDWQAESAAMGDVYGNSMLTIAAGSATDSSKGCFFQRNALSTRPCHAPVFSEWCLVERRPNPYDEVFGDLRIKSSFVLEERAWVLQEQILACRTVTFMSDGVYWNCASLSASEQHPIGLPGVPQEKMNYRSRLQGIIYGTGLFPGLRKAVAYGFWYRTVMDHSHRQLTYQKDKLPAIYGVASKMGESVCDEYIAGIWKSDIHVGLLWMIDSFPELHKPRVASIDRTYRAPSWSWASVEAFIDYTHVIPSLDLDEHILVQQLLELIDVRSSHTDGQDSLEEVSKTVLRVRAPLLAAKANGSEVIEVNQNSLDRDEDPRLGPCFPDRQVELCFCAPVAILESIIPDEQTSSKAVWCLVLDLEEDTGDRYVRVGICKFYEERLRLFDSRSVKEFSLV